VVPTITINQTHNHQLENIMTPQQTITQLNELRLTGMAEQLGYQFEQPNAYEELGFIERFGLLVSHEATCRDNRKIARLLKQAKLRLSAHPQDIDYRTQRGLHKDTLAQLLSLDWIHKARNVLIEGPTGTGKTFFACVLGQAACEHGLSTRYFRASRLFEALTLSHGDGSFGKLLAQLAKAQLLIIDDWGLDTLTQQQRNDLLEVIEDRNGSGATLITSQLSVKHWHDAVGEPTLADAILDRLLHNAHRIKLEGPSMRKIRAEKEKSADSLS
jgi:DNA replication protein DnaC